MSGNRSSGALLASDLEWPAPSGRPGSCQQGRKFAALTLYGSREFASAELEGGRGFPSASIEPCIHSIPQSVGGTDDAAGHLAVVWLRHAKLRSERLLCQAEPQSRRLQFAGKIGHCAIRSCIIECIYAWIKTRNRLLSLRGDPPAATHEGRLSVRRRRRGFREFGNGSKGLGIGS